MSREDLANELRAVVAKQKGATGDEWSSANAEGIGFGMALLASYGAANVYPEHDKISFWLRDGVVVSSEHAALLEEVGWHAPEPDDDTSADDDDAAWYCFP